MTSGMMRRFMIATLLLMGLTTVPSLAFAIGPPALTPQTILSEGFESVPYTRAETSWVLPTPGDPSPAYWGRVTQRRHSGSYGLWCAGAIPNSASNGWTTYSGKYPAFTAGMVTFQVPELQDYYSASLGYWYNMPSVGARDSDAFNVAWATAGSDFWDGHAGQSLVSTMSYTSFSMSAPTPDGAFRPVNLSRTAGKVRFLFIDDVDTYESPSIGEGATIDDVTVSGYKYGPVRNLAPVVSGGQVVLGWNKPLASTQLLASEDTRTITYRVWRSPDVLPRVWTEVTSSRIGTTGFADADPLDGKAWYIVQAWDPDLGTGYGEVDVNAAVSATVVPPIPVSTIAVDPAVGPYTTVPAISVSRSTLRGTTYYRWDSDPFAASTAQSFSVAGFVGTHTLEVYSTNSLGMEETPHRTRTITVTPPFDPGPAPVSTIVASGTTDALGTYITTPTITVSRDQPTGTTSYHWDDGSDMTTSAATFTLPALAGAHTLYVRSTSATDVREVSTVSRTLTVSVPIVKTKAVMGTPTLSTSYVRHNKAFYIKGTVKPSHAETTTVEVRTYRYYSGAYHYQKTYKVTVKPGVTSFSVRLALSKTGTYRTRSYHACPLHLGTYSLYRKFSVHT